MLRNKQQGQWCRAGLITRGAARCCTWVNPTTTAGIHCNDPLKNIEIAKNPRRKTLRCLINGSPIIVFWLFTQPPLILELFAYTKPLILFGGGGVTETTIMNAMFFPFLINFCIVGLQKLNNQYKAYLHR